jgi:hypothetical protein
VGKIVSDLDVVQIGERGAHLPTGPKRKNHRKIFRMGRKSRRFGKAGVLRPLRLQGSTKGGPTTPLREGVRRGAAFRLTQDDSPRSRLDKLDSCVSSVGAGAGRRAIQRSASSRSGERSSKPFGRFDEVSVRAASPISVCLLIQPMSVLRATATLNIATGGVIGQCMKRRRHQEGLKFLRTIDRNRPGVPSPKLCSIPANLMSVSARSAHRYPKAVGG